MTEPARPPRPTVAELIALNRQREVFYSDTGNAKRFVRLFGDVVRYSPETEQWYVWSETHWAPDVEDRVFELTEHVIADLRAEALTLPDHAENGGQSPRERALQHALKMEAEPARRRMLSSARSDPRVVVLTEQLDSAPAMLACVNGTVDLDTGRLIDTHASHLNTACVRVAYDPHARSRDLDTYLATFMPDAEDQAVLFGVLGTALRSGNAARLLPMFLGPSTSGKSQLMAAVAHLLRGYATSINVSVFRGNLDDRPRPDLVRAMRARLVYASEAARSWELHADQVKRLTGGDAVPYRNLYGQTIEAEPRFTPFIVANEMPRVKGADEAFRRRMLVVRFERVLDPGREDIRVRQRFVSDEDCLRALLARMVAGARSDLFVNGVNWSLLPLRFAMALADAFDEVDHVGSFLLWMTEQGHLQQADLGTPASHCAKASDLHGWYGHWVKKHGDRADRESALNLRDFGAALRTRGWEAAKVAGTRWVGWKLLSDVNWL